MLIREKGSFLHQIFIGTDFSMIVDKNVGFEEIDLKIIYFSKNHHVSRYFTIMG